MVDVKFLLQAVIGLAKHLPLIGSVLHDVGGGEIFLIALKLGLKRLGRVNACSLGIGNLLLVKHKAVQVLLERLFLDLLLVVLVVQVFKLREFDVLAINGHEDRILLSKREDHRSQQQ